MPDFNAAPESGQPDINISPGEMSKPTVQLGAEKNKVMGYQQITAEMITRLDTGHLMKQSEQFCGFYFRNEGTRKDLPGQWKNGIIHRIRSKGSLLPPLSWNNTVTFWGQHGLVVSITRSTI